MASVVVELDPSIGTVVDNPLKSDWGPGRIVGTKGKKRLGRLPGSSWPRGQAHGSGWTPYRGVAA